MKSLLIIFCALCISFSGFTQKKLPGSFTPHFNAIIVSDMDTSLLWYRTALGYEILNQRELPEMGLRQANLSNGSSNLELIELSSAITPEEFIPNYTQKIKIIGLFKFGFEVENFDQWIEYLTSENVQFNGGVVIDEESNKRMTIILDPDDNRIQLFER